MKLAEERGLGQKSMREKAVAAGLPLPKYSWNAPYLVLTLFRSVAASISTLPPEVLNRLGEAELMGWQWLTTKGRTSTQEYANAVNLTSRTAQRHLKRFVEFEYPDESDDGPYPIPNDPPIEGGPKAPDDSDRHVIMIDAHNKKLYELFQVLPAGQGNWKAGSGAIFDLTSNKLRPMGWTSADAAGLPIFPGLVRYDETIEQGEIKHALRFTVRRTQRAYGPSHKICPIGLDEKRGRDDTCRS